MLAILSTHPIQYQVPLWQMLARDGRVRFEVWYLSAHATERSRDREFGQEFAWDLDMLSGYRYRFLKTRKSATPNTPLRSRVTQSLPDLFWETKTKVLWVQGWQVAAYWQAIWAAHKTGVQVWLRGESNALAPTPAWKQAIKRPLLGALFRRVDHFFCIGTANRELYRSYGVPESKLHMAPYAVDNERFASQARAIRNSRSAIRNQWRIPDDAYVVLFCGKFIPKKRPFDLIEAAQLLLTSRPELKTHLLFVGSGELGAEMRAACHVVFDAERQAKSEEPSAKGAERSAGSAGHPPLASMPLAPSSGKPRASFAGFLNQTEITAAYVAADVLVLPSDYSETWGLVVNEAMASGLRCIISDRCGCSLDLGKCAGNVVFPFGDVTVLAEAIARAAVNKCDSAQPPSFSRTVDVISKLYLAS